MQYDRVMGPSVRAALLEGFAIVFALWLLWGYQLVRSLHTIEQNVTSVHDSYVRGEQTLSKIRTNVLVGSIYLRDALIDGETARRESYRGELMRLRTEVEELLHSYLPAVTSSDAREHWTRDADRLVLDRVEEAEFAQDVVCRRGAAVRWRLTQAWLD